MLLENVPMLLKYVPMLRFAGTIERDLTGILLGFRKNPRFINPWFPGRGFVCENQSGAAPAAQAAGEKKFLHFAPPMLQCAQMLKRSVASPSEE